MMATDKRTKAPTPAELHKMVDDVHADVCDIGFHIKLVMREFNGDPQTSFALLRSIDRFSDEIFDKLDKLRDITKEHYTELASASLAGRLDQWIKVTPETLPSDQLHVDVFMPGDDSVERAFYDADAKVWTDACDGNTYIDGAITHWRIGSRPSMARGSACGKGGADA
jgi:hypothetical protein